MSQWSKTHGSYMDHKTQLILSTFHNFFSQQWHTNVKENYLMQLVFNFQPLWCTHFRENVERRMLDFGPRGRVKYIICDDVINHRSIITHQRIRNNVKEMWALKLKKEHIPECEILWSIITLLPTIQVFLSATWAGLTLQVPGPSFHSASAQHCSNGTADDHVLHSPGYRVVRLALHCFKKFLAERLFSEIVLDKR